MGAMPTQTPPTAQQLEATAWRFIERGELKQAIACCSDLNRQHPDFAPGWRTASHIARRLNNYSMALTAIGKAVALEPDNTQWQLDQAYCLMQAGQTQIARPLILSLASATLGTAYQNATLGLLLSRLNEHTLSAQKYQAAVRLEPGASQHHYNLATVQRFLGDFDAADASLATALAANPHDYDAHKLRADLRRQTIDNNHIETLQRLLNSDIKDPRGRVSLHYALAKELEDIGEYPRAFESLQAGASARRKMMRYDVAGDVNTMQLIQQTYGAEQFNQQNPGSNNIQPIFVLGLPRTGSTLVEQILASHSQVSSEGELNNFALEMTRLVRQVSNNHTQLTKEEMVRHSAGLDFAGLGDAYIASTRPNTENSPRFIDKMPLNFLYAGLIHKALPNAKIIHLRRHPLDTCYAIFKTLFQDAYPFSYQLQELAGYYLAYRKLMQHWEAVMPGVMYHLDYEKLVTEPEQQTRDLLAYCELDWEPRCLEFYEHGQASTTASASQVREPVYQSSVGKWRHYEEQLQPLLDLLHKAGVPIDTRVS